MDEKDGPVLMGFHPHGIYPLTTFWGTRGPSFRAAFPKLEVDVCGASVMFNCPVLREILLWSGGREVSAASIRHCLHQRRSILLVPGGQREMLHSRADPRSLTYVTKHKGFVRMAIENGARLVPVLSLGETFCLENVYLPRVQSWFLRNTGVGFPVFPLRPLVLAHRQPHAHHAGHRGAPDGDAERRAHRGGGRPRAQDVLRRDQTPPRHLQGGGRLRRPAAPIQRPLTAAGDGGNPRGQRRAERFHMNSGS